MGFENAGIFSLAMSLCASFYTIASYGMRTYQASDTSKEHSASTYITSRVLTCLLSLIVCIIFILLNNYSLYQTACILLYMTFKISEALIDVYHAIDQLNMRMDIIGKSFIIRSILTSAIFIAIICITKNLLFGIVALSTFSFLIALFYDRKQAKKFYVKKKTSYILLKKLLVAAFPIMVFTFIFTTFTTIPKYFIENIYGRCHQSA